MSATCRATWCCTWRRLGSPIGASSRRRTRAQRPIASSGNSKLNPYAGGEVRNFIRPHMAERIFTAHRPITIEARLYLNGQYQTLVEKQVIVQGGPDDPDLAAAVAGVTQNLLGPQGAFRAIDSGPPPTQGPR